jgi:N-acetyl-gamma-glutamyl-phosphate reductase
MKRKVAVVGASGYAGAELLRLLVPHPGVELVAVTSETYTAKPVVAALPSLTGFVDISFEPLEPERLASVAEIVFLALPHTASAAPASSLLDAGCRVIDLSADFRLKDPKTYEHWYQATHAAPHLLSEAVYGLPELYREAIRQARLAAVPGCYPTGALLGLLPLMRAGRIGQDSIIVNAASGTSGAGRKLDLPLHFSEANENFKAYAVASHRHTPEIERRCMISSSKRTRENPSFGSFPLGVSLKRSRFGALIIAMSGSPWIRELAGPSSSRRSTTWSRGRQGRRFR